MQDEIALKVAQALKLSLEVAATERASGQEAMSRCLFEYLQARSVLAEVRNGGSALSLGTSAARTAAGPSSPGRTWNWRVRW